MLEQESLPGVRKTTNSYANVKHNGNSDSKSAERFNIDSLIKKLNEFLSLLNSHGVDPEIVNQIFKQVNMQTNLPSIFSFINWIFMLSVILFYRLEHVQQFGAA